MGDEENDSYGISAALGLRGLRKGRRVWQDHTALVSSKGLCPALRYQGDALSARVERFGPMCVSKFRPEGVLAESFTCRQPSSSTGGASHQE